MNKLQKIFICCLFILFTAKNVYAASNAGTTVFNFLKTPINASQAGVAGMAGFSAYSGGVNPAMLDFLSGKVLSASYAVYFQDTSFNSLSFSMPLKTVGINVSYGGFDYGKMDKYIEDAGGNYVKSGTFGANDAFIGANIGMQIKEYLSVGAGLKYIWQDIDGNQISGTAATVTGVYLSEKEWYITGGFENIGPAVEGYKLPSNAFAAYMSSYEEYSILYGIELKAFFDSSIWLKAAGEYNYRDLLYVRAGYSLPVSDADEELGDWYTKNLSLGFGVEYEFIKFDFAWMPSGDLGSTSMFSLQFLF